MTRYAHEPAKPPPFWRRCKTRHSPAIRVRCRHSRGHEGEHRFGWLAGRNLDAPRIIIDQQPRTGAPVNFDG